MEAVNRVKVFKWKMPKKIKLLKKRTRIKNVQTGKIKSDLESLTLSWKLHKGELLFKRIQRLYSKKSCYSKLKPDFLTSPTVRQCVAE